MDKPKVGFPVFMTHIRDCLHDTSSAGQRRAKTDSTLGQIAGLPYRPSHTQASFENRNERKETIRKTQK
jgi:hypothetical protein